MPLLIIGGRNWLSQADMDELLNDQNPDALIIGTNTTEAGHLAGADYLASIWATATDTPILRFDADRLQGTFASGLRNQRMLEEGQPDKALHFPAHTKRNAYGIADLIYRLGIAGIPIETIDIGPPKPHGPVGVEPIKSPPKSKKPKALATYQKKREWVSRCPYMRQRSGPFSETDAERYVRWQNKDAVCPYCTKYHWPGTRHRGKTVAETRQIDAALSARDAAEREYAERLKEKGE